MKETVRETVTLFVPEGYADADDFLKDCQFERAETPTPILLETLIKRLQWDGNEADLNTITIGEMRRAI
jgi:hypothetical protein